MTLQNYNATIYWNIQEALITAGYAPDDASYADTDIGRLQKSNDLANWKVNTGKSPVKLLNISNTPNKDELIFPSIVIERQSLSYASYAITPAVKYLPAIDISGASLGYFFKFLNYCPVDLYYKVHIFTTNSEDENNLVPLVLAALGVTYSTTNIVNYGLSKSTRVLRRFKDTAVLDFKEEYDLSEYRHRHRELGWYLRNVFIANSTVEQDPTSILTQITTVINNQIQIIQNG